MIEDCYHHLYFYLLPTDLASLVRTCRARKLRITNPNHNNNIKDIKLFPYHSKQTKDITYQLNKQQIAVYSLSEMIKFTRLGKPNLPEAPSLQIRNLTEIIDFTEQLINYHQNITQPIPMDLHYLKTLKIDCFFSRILQPKFDIQDYYHFISPCLIGDIWPKTILALYFTLYLYGKSSNYLLDKFKIDSQLVNNFRLLYTKIMQLDITTLSKEYY